MNNLWLLTYMVKNTLLARSSSADWILIRTLVLFS